MLVNTPKEKEVTKPSVNITRTELISLLAEAYRSGYAIYEIHEAGLEPYDPVTYAQWVVNSVK